MVCNSELHNMTISLLDIISIVTTFQLILLAIVIINYQKGKRISNRILAVFMLSNAFLVGNFVAFRMRVLSIPAIPFLYVIGTSSYLLLGPLLYLYTKSLCYHNFKFRKIDCLHFVPFILISLFLIIHYYVRLAGVEEGTPGQIRCITFLDSIIKNGTLHVQILIYMILTLRTLYLYRSGLKELFSSIEKISLSWLLFLLFGFILMWLMDVVSFAMRIMDFNSGEIHNILLFFSLTINFIFATVIVYRGLKHPELFSGIEQRPKYATSRLTKEQAARYIEKITNYMKKEKPYLDPALSLNELAEHLALSPRYLSQSINYILNQNFFDFINSYRIDEAKDLFSDPCNETKTILEILYEVGFNSKSVFNNAFKRHTGMTPTEFRKTYQR